MCGQNEVCGWLTVAAGEITRLWGAPAAKFVFRKEGKRSGRGEGRRKGKRKRKEEEGYTQQQHAWGACRV